MRLVQGCLCPEMTRRFNLQGGTVKHVQACLSAREDCESSFERCGSIWRTCDHLVYLTHLLSYFHHVKPSHYILRMYCVLPIKGSQI